MATDVPVTIWRDTDGLSEYSNEGANDIVDTLDNNLVDINGNNIVDTGVVRTRIPSTEWVEDDSQ